jgi:hypothetical protein
VVNGPKLAAARKKVLAQAEALGHRLSSDPGLDVIVDGRTVRPEIAGKTWCVRLPPAARSIRLVSRAWVPAHTRANETDTRSLGVAIANLRLDGRAIPLDDPRMSSGWLAPEQADGEAAAAEWRWTDGDAGLALAGVRDLTFDLVMTGTYWEATVGRKSAASSADASCPNDPGSRLRPLASADDASLVRPTVSNYR